MNDGVVKVMFTPCMNRFAFPDESETSLLVAWQCWFLLLWAESVLFFHSEKLSSQISRRQLRLRSGFSVAPVWLRCRADAPLSAPKAGKDRENGGREREEEAVLRSGETLSGLIHWAFNRVFTL